MNSGRMSGIARTCWAWILVVLVGVAAFGQAGRGSISGTVTDPGGALVPGAQVALLNTATGVSLHTVTSAAGLYSFISLNPGVYKVTVSQTGFANVTQENITVNVDQVTQVNIPLKVGTTTEQVTVTAGVALVEPTNSLNKRLGSPARPALPALVIGPPLLK